MPCVPPPPCLIDMKVPGLGSWLWVQALQLWGRDECILLLSEHVFCRHKQKAMVQTCLPKFELDPQGSSVERNKWLGQKGSGLINGWNHLVTKMGVVIVVKEV